jgi:hypothetical protein
VLTSTAAGQILRLRLFIAVGGLISTAAKLVEILLEEISLLDMRERLAKEGSSRGWDACQIDVSPGFEGKPKRAR